MNTVRRVVAVACVAVCLAGSPHNRADAQTATQFTRQSDVIYGRKLGVALTMEVLAPATRNGLGVASDVRRAVRFVRYRAADFGIDGQRIGISGSSAGGLLALVVAMQGEEGKPTSDDEVERVSSRVQAVGCFFPPTDLMNYGAPSQNIIDFMLKHGGSVDPSFQFYELGTKAGARKPLTAREDVLRVLREMSPMTHVTADDPPTILIHGDQDKTVPVEQSRSLVARLSDAKVPARLVVREGSGHAYAGWEADTRLIADWFDEHLRRVR